MEHLSSKQKATIMLAIIVAMFFSAINQTIVGTAMPRIIAVLGGMDYYTWVITIYLLTSTVSTILVGKLSDIYGRKPFILLGIVIFMGGAFMSGLSKDVFDLITYRGIQGVGAGIIMSTVFTAVGDLYSPRERGKWTGVLMAAFGVSSVLGPPLGGWIVDHMDWKWLFWIFLPLGIFAFLMILLLFPKTSRRVGEKIDVLGSIVLSILIITLLLGFTWGGTRYAWGSLEILGLFATVLVLLVLFIFIERKAKSPVLPLSLFRNDIVTISNSIGFLMNAGMMGALIYLPIYVQGVEGISPTYSGYVTMPMSISMVIVSALVGKWITKTGKYKRYALVGLPIMILGMLIMAYMDQIWVSVLAMFVFGAGLGTGMPVFSVTVQNAVSPDQLGVVTASSQLFRNLGGTIGIAVMGTLMQSQMAKNMRLQAEEHGIDFAAMDPSLAQQFAEISNPETLLDHPKLEQIRQSLPDDVQPLFTQMMDTVRDALSMSLSTVFLYGAASIGIALILTLMLREIPLRTSNSMTQSDASGNVQDGATKSRSMKLGEGDLG